jgi:hypothetical protein
LKSSFLAAVKSGKSFLYNTVVAKAYRVEVEPSRITFTFLPNQRVPKQQCEESRAALETIAEQVAGARIPVVVKVADPAGDSGAPAAAAAGNPPPRHASTAGDVSLRDEAMAHPAVQALFEIFPVEKTKIEEM